MDKESCSPSPADSTAFSTLTEEMILDLFEMVPKNGDPPRLWIRYDGDLFPFEEVVRGALPQFWF